MPSTPVKVIKRRRFSKRALIAIAVLLIVVIVAVLELTNTTHFFHKQKVPATIPVAKTSANARAKAKSTADKSAAASAVTGQPDAQSDKSQASASPDSSLVLVQPFGNFVSNHRPGQGGTDTKEQSACDTSPGASCYIQFTNTSSGVTTKLPSQTVGTDGSTIWNWDAGILSSGEWEIKAVAALNGQTKSVTDGTKLEVQ